MKMQDVENEGPDALTGKRKSVKRRSEHRRNTMTSRLTSARSSHVQRCSTIFTAWMKRETTERRTAKLHKEGAYKMHRNVVPRFGRFYVLGRVHLIDIGDIGYWGTCGLDFQQFIFFS